MIHRIIKLLYVCCLFVPASVFAQEQPDPITFLPESRLQLLIDEVSGALVMNHVMELGGYNRDRRQEEYEGIYHESRYIVDKAEQYGFIGAHIETFPLDEWTWDAVAGELWLEKPVRRLIVSHRDIPAALATGSWNADVSAQLVYAGAGIDSSDYEGLEVKDRLVLISGSMSRAHNLAVRTFGAAGVLSFNNPVGRPFDRTDQIAWQGIGSGTSETDFTVYPYEASFGFNLSHRMGMELLAMLEAGRQVELRAVVRTATYPADMEAPTAAIPGDGTTDQEILLVAHLFEGMAKQGANDNMSGAAAILEAGRALIRLIDTGRLPRPHRTIRFLWVPEFSGAFAYLDRFPDERNRIIAAINVDMIGSHQTKNRNSLHLYRNPYSMASFVDDITQVMFEYVGDTNREKVHNRGVAYAYRTPILDPTGSRDPFYYNIEKYYGSSDHAALNGPAYRIPAVLFNNWPDIAYHTSEDRTDNLDPTQLKRGAFLLAASAWHMANITARDVPRLATRMASMSARRIDDDVMQQLELVSTAPLDQVAERYRDAQAFIDEAYKRERRSLESLMVFTTPKTLEASQLASIVSDLMKRASFDQDRIRNHFRRINQTINQPLRELKETDEERIAGRLYPVFIPVSPDTSVSVIQRMRKVLDFNAPPSTLRGIKATECKMFCDGQRSILDIRNALSAEFGPVPLADVLQFVYDLEKRGMVFIRRP